MKTADDWTREYRAFVAVFEQVNAELSRIPGVIRISVGVKDEAGRRTERMAFRVYVREKLPEEALPPEQVVPRSISGYPTDVVVEHRKVNVVGFQDENDQGSYETKVGGIQIGNDQKLETGTLGCFATRNEDSKLVLLSNYHVLLSNYPKNLTKSQIEALKVKIGQPRYCGCLCCGCNGIGVVVDGAGGSLDCAIAAVNEGVPYYDRIRRILRSDASIEQEGMFLGYDEEHIPGHKVWKVGKRTGLTRGTIVDAPLPLNAVAPTDIMIDPDLPFSLFVNHGDSGSVLVSRESMKIVGLCKSAEDSNPSPAIENLTGRAFATPIRLVMDAMKIQINGSDELWWSEVGRRLPDVSTRWEPPFAPIGDRLRQSPIGAQALALIETHRSELLRLVNTSRRGMVAWQRLQGPSFAAAYARSAKEPLYKIPRMINGISRRRALADVHAMLQRLGSEPLRRDLARYDSALIALLRRHDSVDALLETVEQDRTAAGRA